MSILKKMENSIDASMVKCPRCHGSGKQECGSCDGTGKETCPSCSGLGTYTSGLFSNSQCIRCNATGYIDEKCFYCKGTGNIKCNRCKGEGWVKKVF